jgi:hypothetical protein
MFQRPFSHIKISPTALEVSEARFKRFLKELETYERKLTFERTLDSFLDLYSSWKKTHEPPIKLRLVMLAFELHRLNRQFRCDLSFQDQPLDTPRKGGVSSSPCANQGARSEGGQNRGPVEP